MDSLTPSNLAVVGAALLIAKSAIDVLSARWKKNGDNKNDMERIDHEHLLALRRDVTDLQEIVKTTNELSQRLATSQLLLNKQFETYLANLGDLTKFHCRYDNGRK